jgi:nicotinamide-nucleotide amidase
MALGVAEKLHTNCSIAVSGIAGPGGGTPSKPVGTCWICINVNGDLEAKMFRFGDNRMHNITVASFMAIFMLLKKLENL